ncbi:MAG TPA: NUDIX domain-containing protein [Chitinophagaceae bacterium]|nr:NUDIX domain-containing protein [Chitinophagaceae bacterium]
MSHIIIYFGDKPVYLCNEINKETEQLRHHPDAVFIDELSTAAINSLLHEINKREFHAGIIFNEDFDKLKKSFFKHFTLVKTGGGLVENESGDVLLIFRRGKWDLPKGKQDEGETLAECAIREVREETGLRQLQLGKEINTTYHTYTESGKQILKESHWFLMKAEGNEQFVPQTEEDITEIIWVNKSNLKNYFANMYPTIISVLKNA